MSVHELKAWPEFYDAILHGYKTFDLRKDDRDYQVGDILVLNEWEPATASMADGGSYTGRTIRRRVTYVMRGVGPGGGAGIVPLRGLSSGYAILALAE